MTETIANAPSPGADASPSPMQRAYFSHMSLPVRDREEAVRFFVNVLGGEVVLDLPAFSEVRLAGTIIGLSQQKGGWTAPDAEYPHYTLRVDPENLLPLKERLESYGVPTSDVYTRNGTDAAIYYRDPAGNLWELNCERGYKGSARQTPSAGGDYVPDVKSLCYDHWNDQGR